MARSRNIKPSIMDNEDLAELDPLTRLLFIYLWMLADRDGRLEDRPKRIAAQALPYDRAADVESMLSGLHKLGFIDRYEVNGILVIQIVSFSKHQTPHVRESASALPEKVQSITKAVPEHNLGSAEASPRSPDSLIPDSLIPDSNANDAKASPKPSKSMPDLPDWIPVEAWNGYAEMRTRIRKPMTARAMTLVLNELSRIHSAGHDIGTVLDKSTRNNWVEVYAPKPHDAGQKLQNAPNNRPQWVIDAGFSSVAEAHNERCYERNANEFKNGKRVEVQA